MTYYDENPYQLEWDTEYAREVYWESKGMGNATINFDTIASEFIAKPVFPKYPCEKCGRMGTMGELYIHNKNYPNCDK